MLRTLSVLVVVLVAVATLADATLTDPLTDPVQQDPGTTLLDGDAGDTPETATPLKVNGQHFDEFGVLVPADDPRDYYVVQLAYEPGELGSLSVRVAPVALDIELVVMDLRGGVWFAQPRGAGEPESVEIEYAMPGPYIIGIHDVTCGASGLPCAQGPSSTRVPLSMVAGDYELAMTCIPYC